MRLVGDANLKSKREIYAPQQKGYSDAGASQRKRALKGFKAQSGSAVEDIDFHNMTIRQRGRMLYMFAPIATSAIKTNRTNVIGLGLKLNSRIDRELLNMSAKTAEAWQKKTETEFALWATNKWACDAIAMNDFYEIQQLALVSWLLSGDCFCVFKSYEPSFIRPYSLRLHLIEADRVATPLQDNCVTAYITEGTAKNGNKIHDGVEVDSSGMVVAYYIRNQYPFESYAYEAAQWTRIPALGINTGLPNIIQIMESERPDQYRGISYLAQVIEPLLQLRRYTESEIMAALVESFFTAFIKTDANADEMPFNETNQERESQYSVPEDYHMGSGEINIMKKGEDVVFADPKRPSNGFTGFCRAVCVQIGAALEIPADLLLKEFNASYSASRAALMEAWKGFRMRRQWFASDFCMPIYELWLSEAVARGRVSAPGFFNDPLIRAAYLGAEWTGPSQGQLDPIREIQAEIMAVEHGFSTHEQSTIRLNGGNWRNNMAQLKRENENKVQNDTIKAQTKEEK